jgi:hypothetical protein
LLDGTGAATHGPGPRFIFSVPGLSFFVLFVLRCGPCRQAFTQFLPVQHRQKFDFGLQFLEQRLGNLGYLGRVLKVKKEEGCALSSLGEKVGGLGLYLFLQGSNDLAHLCDDLVSGLQVRGHPQHSTHVDFLQIKWGLNGRWNYGLNKGSSIEKNIIDMASSIN